MRSATSDATVFLKKNDSPKSPRAMLPIQTKNCATIGRSRPSFGADAGDVLRGRGRARDDRGRIAGRQAQQREDDQTATIAITGIVASRRSRDVGEHQRPPCGSGFSRTRVAEGKPSGCSRPTMSLTSS